LFEVIAKPGKMDNGQWTIVEAAKAAILLILKKSKETTK
jgi:hypothetical protein